MVVAAARRGRLVAVAASRRGREAAAGGPDDVLLQFFDELADQPERQDMRYVLALLLVRRRVFRLEEDERNATGGEVLVLHCPRRDATYEVPVILPDQARIDEIQQELARLLE